MAKEKKGIRFEFCNEHRGDVLNIFIHGYSAAVDEKDELTLKSKVPERNKNSTNLFLFWPAGNLKSFSFKSLRSLFSMNFAGMVHTALSLSQEAIQKFKEIEENVSKLSYEFLYKLEAFIKSEGIEYKQMNLYGHSLGARLIIESMLQLSLDFKGLKVNNLVFMGGARELNSDECERLLDVISGNVVNIHSAGDRVLQFIKPDLEKCIGRYPINYSGEQSWRVKNYAFDWLGHLDYWNNLTGILNYLNFDSHSTQFLIPAADAGKKNNFATADIPLYLVLVHATDTERLILSGLLNQKRSVSIKINETSASALTHEIQLMGGDSVANKIRGHGVIYSEIVHDAADELNISPRDSKGFVDLESEIQQKILHLMAEKKSAFKVEEVKDYENVMSYLHDQIQREVMRNLPDQDAILNFSKMVVSSVPVSLAKGINISGTAFSVTIPVIMVIHHIRQRLINEIGPDFMFIPSR